jgi:hypothetical protein
MSLSQEAKLNMFIDLMYFPKKGQKATPLSPCHICVSKIKLDSFSRLLLLLNFFPEEG